MVIIISGATCVGKSEVAIRLSQRLNGEIINADSMQVYKYFDIASAKPEKNELRKVRHHLIDILNPDEDFSAGEFKKRALSKISDTKKRGNVPVISGGTGLYIKTLTNGYKCGVKSDRLLRKDLEKEILEKGVLALYNRLKKIDPDYAQIISPNDKSRILRALEVFFISKKPFSFFLKKDKDIDIDLDYIHIYLERDRNELYARIDKRVDEMFEHGLVDEVKKIINMGFSADLKPFKSIGYRQVVSFIRGDLTLDNAIYETKKETRYYAKRQLTWFRHIKGIKKIYINQNDFIDEIVERIYNVLSL